MTYNEFWYGDPRLLSVCQKSYMRDKSYGAWLQGKYDCVAYSIAMSNAFAKKGTPSTPYPDWQDPIEKFEKIHNKKENYEVEHRNQQMWFYNMINN